MTVNGRTLLQAAWFVFVAAFCGLAVLVAAWPQAHRPARIGAGLLAAVAVPYLVGLAIGAFRSRDFWVSVAIVIGALLFIPAFGAAEAGIEALLGVEPPAGIDLFGPIAAPSLLAGALDPKRERAWWRRIEAMLPFTWALAFAVAVAHAAPGAAREALAVAVLFAASAAGMGASYLREGRPWSAVIAVVVFGVPAALPPRPARAGVVYAILAIWVARVANDGYVARRRSASSPPAAP